MKERGRRRRARRTKPAPQGRGAEAGERFLHPRKSVGTEGKKLCLLEGKAADL